MTATLVLPVAPPFDPGPLLASLSTHAVPGVEETDVAAATTRRLVHLGRPVEVRVRLASQCVMVTAADLPATPGPDHAALGVLVRRWFDLDADVAQVAAVLGGDPDLGPLVAQRPGLRVLGHPSGWEAALQTVLGQQVSVAAGRTFTGRLVAALGGEGPGGLATFPAPSTVAAAGADAVRAATGVTGARARTVHALAQVCADGLRVDAAGDHAELRRHLLAVPGIGPWTVAYLAVRALGDRDALPAGDLVLRRVLGIEQAAELAERARAWAPFRSYGACHLWAAAGVSARRGPGG